MHPSVTRPVGRELRQAMAQGGLLLEFDVMTSNLINLSEPSTAKASPSVTAHPTLLDYEIDDLVEMLAAEGQPAYRARQLFGALHQRFVGDWERISEFPVPLRAKLAERY